MKDLWQRESFYLLLCLHDPNKNLQKSDINPDDLGTKNAELRNKHSSSEEQALFLGATRLVSPSKWHTFSGDGKQSYLEHVKEMAK